MGITIDGTEVSGVTIDGTEVVEITMDGDVVWTNTANRLYGGEVDGNTIHKYYELNPDTFGTINSTNFPYEYTQGVGGIKGRLFASTQQDGCFELNLDTFEIISSSGTSSPYDGLTMGIGGLETRLFIARPNKEINPDNWSVIADGSSPGDYPSGIGGMANGRLYLAESQDDNFHELNPDTWDVLNTESCTGPSGAGGIRDRLYTVDDDYWEERNMDDLSVLNSDPFSDATGIGGTK